MAPPERLVRASCVSWAYEVRPAIADALARLGPGGRHGDPAHDRDHRSADDDPMRTPVLPGILFRIHVQDPNRNCEGGRTSSLHIFGASAATPSPVQTEIRDLGNNEIGT